MKKSKMTAERRKDKRYKCLLPAHVLQAEGKDKLVQRTTVHDFSRGGCKLIVNIITLDPGSDIELELYVPEKGLKTPLRAEVAWKKMSGGRFLLPAAILFYTRISSSSTRRPRIAT